MRLVIKNVNGSTYYWNKTFNRWEGLMDNATRLSPEEYEKLQPVLVVRDFTNIDLTKKIKL